MAAAAEVLYEKATKFELDGNFDRAFQLYIKSAEEHIRLSRLSEHPASRQIHKSAAAKSLERAEKIKLKKGDLVTPIARDSFAEGEQLRVLHHSSMVNGVHYPLWADSSAQQTIDLSSPRLSQEQIKLSASWNRPPPSDYILSGTRDSLYPEDVIQHIVTDCSLCASVSVCIWHNRQFASGLGVSALYPQNSDRHPIPSTTEFHTVKVFFNGAYRKANIDDHLPMYPDRGLMCMSTGSRRVLWPSLIEKAYMKLMGGYDFPGSLSTTDLHTLTGWIPETIEISSPTFERERTWVRISEAFSQGQCLLTVGTGVNLLDEHLLPLSLLPAHCYAIVNVVNNGEDRRLTILDNWIESPQKHDHSQDHGMKSAPSHDQKLEEERSSSCTISWDTLSRNTLTRLAVDSSAESDVWILLTRHIVDTKRSDEYISISVEVEDEGRVQAPMLKGSFTNNTHVLTKMRCLSCTLDIAASYDGAYDDVGFTLTVYSSAAISWSSAPPVLPYNQKTSGILSSKNSGGNPTLPTFMLNPQYHLRIHPDRSLMQGSTAKSRLSINLTGERHVPFNVSLVWSAGQRVTAVEGNDLAMTTGAYTFGHAATMKSLPPGDYTLVVSAFEPRYTGSFNLKIDCSTRIDITTIPQEGAGMFKKTVQGAWTIESAGGGPSFNKYMSNPMYELTLPFQSHVLIRLHLLIPRSSTALNVTLFRATSAGALGTLIATSGPYDDALCGVVTPQVNCQPGSYFIIPSTHNPGVLAGFRLTIHTSASGAAVEFKAAANR
ncbi:cysteine proteinase [Trametopsis cervina]|nr:cysteine proteinase [Trametopsis cervina]